MVRELKKNVRCHRFIAVSSWAKKLVG